MTRKIYLQERDFSISKRYQVTNCKISHLYRDRENMFEYIRRRKERIVLVV